MAEILPFSPRPDFAIGKGKKPLATIENFRAMVKAHLIEIRYNEIKKQVEVKIPAKNYSRDNDLNCSIYELISMANQYEMPCAHVQKYMLSLADENKYNPVCEWIESKPWDGTSRIKEFFDTILSTNEKAKEILLQRWAISAIAAVYEPKGVSAGGMLVLFAKQYAGKTNWFKNLVPPHQSHLIKDGMVIDPHDRDSMVPCLEHWLVELGEIDATFKKAEIAALKAFVNKQEDIFRLPYMPTNSHFPRRTVFFGSVDKRNYLNDPAGNRRFWTIECKKINHTHGLDMQQIWAEFYALYLDGEPWLLTLDEHAMLSEINKDYEAKHPIEEKLLRKFDWDSEIVEYKSATHILEDMNWRTLDKSTQTICGMAVRKLNGDISKTVRGSVLLGLPRESLSTIFTSLD